MFSSNPLLTFIFLRLIDFSHVLHQKVIFFRPFGLLVCYACIIGKYSGNVHSEKNMVS